MNDTSVKTRLVSRTVLSFSLCQLAGFALEQATFGFVLVQKLREAVEAKMKSQTVFEESSVKEVVEASWGEDCPGGLRGGVGFTKRALKEERVGPEAGKTYLSSSPFCQDHRRTNWKNTFFF